MLTNDVTGHKVVV